MYGDEDREFEEDADEMDGMHIEGDDEEEAGPIEPEEEEDEMM